MWLMESESSRLRRPYANCKQALHRRHQWTISDNNSTGANILAPDGHPKKIIPAVFLADYLVYLQ
jgi:hypothetical protein